MRKHLYIALMLLGIGMSDTAVADQILYQFALEPHATVAQQGKAYLFAVPYTLPATGLCAIKNNAVSIASGHVKLYAYNGFNRAIGTDEWTPLTTTDQLTPGVCYKMVLQGATFNTWTCNYTTDPVQTNTAVVSKNASATAINSGWNGIANPSWSSAYASTSNSLSAIQYITCYDNEYAAYYVTTLSDKSWALAEPAFVQAPANGSLTFVSNGSGLEFGGQAPDDVIFDAPQRRQAAQANLLTLQSVDGGYMDRLYLQFQTEIKTAYTIGQDVAKWHGEGTQAPQLWVKNYNTDLSVHTATLQNDMATLTLQVYAPQDGNYVLQAEGPDAQQLTLSIDGTTVTKQIDYWILTLTRGLHTNLVLKRNTTTTTDIQSPAAAQHSSKVMRDGQLYILRDGRLYNVLGGSVE